MGNLRELVTYREHTNLTAVALTEETLRSLAACVPRREIATHGSATRRLELSLYLTN
jgi:hypothetical protein